MSTGMDNVLDAHGSEFVYIEVDDEDFSGHEQRVAFRRRVESAINKVAKPRILIDLRSVKHIPSAAVPIFVSADIRTIGNGGQLLLVRRDTEVEDTLSALKLADRVLMIKPSVSEAIASFSPNGPADGPSPSHDSVPNDAPEQIDRQESPESHKDSQKNRKSNHRFHFLKSDQPDVTIITFADDQLAGPEICAELQRRIHKLLHVTPQSKIVLDMHLAEHVSSNFLAELLRVKALVSGLGGRIHLARLQTSVLDVFEVTHFEDRMPVFDSVRQAVAEFD